MNENNLNTMYNKAGEYWNCNTEYTEQYNPGGGQIQKKTCYFAFVYFTVVTRLQLIWSTEQEPAIYII